MTNPNTPVIHRGERALAFMIAGVAGLSIICMILGIISGIAHFTLVPVVLVFPLFGFPVTIVLIIALVIMNAVRRSREARSSR
ncbi:hypothetical protein [Subtercola frigoramans]|uniref:Phage shock protein PspC (Stress-responsive transcriptional regulator) n=1 Tax=Subtercola frigoramans TaxID=120298 RepID=A0ABS2L318_9MICO|nr:hypothetical protein [Subtercola frigoramans]MBM7471494.1 phage shock protein PspC (stress-responsive transcriptional regulator) [Subtercola frigoramans]